MGNERRDIVVIGGGQAGLAVGYHLARRAQDFVILEAAPRVGESWRKRWESLRLFTPAGFSHLPGMPFPAPRNAFVGKDAVADYLAAYAHRFALPVRLGVRVERLSREGERYVVTATTGALEARQVVVATGAHATPRIPGFADQLDPATLQLHSSAYRVPGELQDGATLVVGAGNSGAEIALDLAAGRRVWLAGRDVGTIPVLGGYAYEVMKRLTIETWLGRALLARARSSPFDPLGRVRPSDFERAGVQRVPRVTGVERGRPRLADGRLLDVANVVWCTGFARDHDWIDLPGLAAHGDLVQHRGVVASEPGLYFVGLPYQSSLASHLLGGVGADAAYVAERVAAATALAR